jgi:hypothetical protein
MTAMAAASLSSVFRKGWIYLPFFSCTRVYNHSVRAFPEADAGTSCPHLSTVEAAALAWILPRWLMTLTIVATVWGIFTAGLIILLIYRSTLTMHEDEQLFLNDASSHMQAEQTELVTKVNRLRIPVWVFGGGSGVFLLILVGMWISQKLSEVQ